MKNQQPMVAKVLVSLTISLMTTAAFAGGDAPPPSTCEKMIETVIRQATVPDRAENQIVYKLILKAQRCERSGETYVLKYLFINYDAPKLRHNNDGLLLASTTNWGKPAKLFAHPSARQDATTGISLQIAGSRYPDSNLTQVPEDLTGDTGTIIEIFGDAFPTHTIAGPLNK